MELDELTLARLIGLAVLIAVVVAWAGARAGRRRRERRFTALARSFGSADARESEFLSSFSAEGGGRTFDIRHQHLSGNAPGWVNGWYLVTSVPLQGVTDLHSAEFRTRGRGMGAIDPDGPDFAEQVTIRDDGFPLPKGWLTRPVRAAIAEFYALDRPLDPLTIEKGHLIHRSRIDIKRWDGERLRALLARQASLARELERVLMGIGPVLGR